MSEMGPSTRASSRRRPTSPVSVKDHNESAVEGPGGLPTSDAAQADSPQPRPRQGVFSRIGAKYALIGVLLLLWVTFSVLNTGAFATTSNLQTILSVQATTGLLALAVVVPIVHGHFDLSTGFQFGLAQSLCAVLIIRDGWSPVAAVVLVIAIGVVIGVINGQLIT